MRREMPTRTRNIRRRLSLRCPYEALTFALRQLTFVAASLGKSSTDPGCDVNVKIQTDLLENILPFVDDPIEIDVTLASLPA